MWNRKHVFALAVAALLVPTALAAQDRSVVSKEVSVGRSEATLHVGFADAGKLSISFRDGSVLVDGKSVGSYTEGGALDASWRALLGKVVSLDDGALASALHGWSPPSGLPSAGASAAKAVQGALDTALSPPTKKGANVAPSAKTRPSDTTTAGQLRALLDRSGQLAALGAALRSVDVQGARIRVDEDVEVKAGETVDGSLVVVDGSVKVAGTVDGDVVVVDGSVEVLPGGEIDGDVRLADANMVRNEGTVTGSVVNVSGQQGRSGHDEIGDQVRAQVRSEIQQRLRHQNNRGFSLFAPVRRIANGIGGILQDLVTLLFLGLIGAGVVTFAGTNLEAVAETAHRTPGRAAAVGVAGTFLLVPVWVVGIIGLAVSIVGIPVMIAWLPLFPLAAVAAAILGYLAVAHNVGKWLAGTDLRFADRIRASNPIHTVTAGVLALIGAFIVANVVSMVPFFGFLEGLLVFVGVVATIIATMIGFGAVLLTRAGTRPEYGFGDMHAEPVWDPEMAPAGPAATGHGDEVWTEERKEEEDGPDA